MIIRGWSLVLPHSSDALQAYLVVGKYLLTGRVKSFLPRELQQSPPDLPPQVQLTRYKKKIDTSSHKIRLPAPPLSLVIKVDFQLRQESRRRRSERICRWIRSRRTSTSGKPRSVRVFHAPFLVLPVLRQPVPLQGGGADIASGRAGASRPG